MAATSVPRPLQSTSATIRPRPVLVQSPTAMPPATAVSESAANGTAVGVTALATDADSTDTVTYSLTDDAGGRFTIDANTGVVTVADGSVCWTTRRRPAHNVTVQATSSLMVQHLVPRPLRSISATTRRRPASAPSPTVMRRRQQRQREHGQRHGGRCHRTCH